MRVMIPPGRAASDMEEQSTLIVYYDKKGKIKTKLRRSIFIVRLNWVDVFSLFGLTSALCSIWNSVRGDFCYALGFMFGAMFFDAFDGVFARRFGTEREFGRYLDGFIDAFDYLIAPAIFLFFWGFNEPLYLTVMVVYVTCGIIRLSVFNQTGNIRTGNRLSYLGMPTFWSHFILAIFYGLSLVVGPKGMIKLFLALTLLAYSFLMILNRPFYKPRSKALMIFIVGSMVLLFFVAGSR